MKKYTLFCAISYKGLEHLWILVSPGVLKSSPTDTEGQTWLNFGGVKCYTQTFGGWWIDTPDPCIVQRSTLGVVCPCIHLNLFLWRSLSNTGGERVWINWEFKLDG